MSDIPSFGVKERGRHWVLRTGVYAVIIQDYKFAAVEEKPGKFFLPGGGVEREENLETALAREIVEELGYEAELGTFLGSALQFFWGGPVPFEMTANFFTCELKSQLNNTHEYVLSWLPLNEMDKLFHACHRWAIKQLQIQE